MIRRWLSTGALIVLGAAGCASPAASAWRNPEFVLLRNNSGRDLQLMEIREYTERVEDPASLGSMAPLLAGQPYVFRRRDHAPPLPGQLRIRWVAAGGQAGMAVVDMDAGPGPGEGNALVFELDGRDKVHVYRTDWE